MPGRETRSTYQLQFFIEGTSNKHSVAIPKTERVSDLQMKVHNMLGKSGASGVSATDLILLKVNLKVDDEDDEDAHHNDAIQVPEDAKELVLREPISKVWPKQPDEHHLHVCVRQGTQQASQGPSQSRHSAPAPALAPAPAPAPAKSRLRAAAEKLHHTLWNKSLVGAVALDNGDVYLPTVVVEDLELRRLGYLEDILLFRQEYKTAVESLDLEESTTKPSSIVIGHPGIGKSCLLYYILLLRLQKSKPTAFQVSDQFILFQGSGVEIYSGDDDEATIPTGTLALTGGSKRAETPCGAFLYAVQVRTARIVQATSPFQDNWKKWQNVYGAGLYVLKCFSSDEMKSLGSALHLDVEKLLHFYKKWGPSARNCLWLMRGVSQESNREAFHQWRVETAIQSFMKDLRSSHTRELDAFNVSHILFSVQPHEDSRMVPVARVATDHISNLILRATVEANATERVRFYKTLSAHSWFRAPAGYLLEVFVLSWLGAHPASTPIKCTPAKSDAPPLEIPVCSPEQVTSVPGLSLQKRIGSLGLPFCWIPPSSIFPTLDAVVCSDTLIITIQTTVSRVHSAKPKGFELVSEYLPASFKERRAWCHVFITGDEENAVALRNQRKLEIPEGTHVYSAVFEVGVLSRIHEKIDLNREVRNREDLSTDTKDPEGDQSGLEPGGDAEGKGDTGGEGEGGREPRDQSGGDAKGAGPSEGLSEIARVARREEKRRAE